MYVGLRKIGRGPRTKIEPNCRRLAPKPIARLPAINGRSYRHVHVRVHRLEIWQPLNQGFGAENCIPQEFCQFFLIDPLAGSSPNLPVHGYQHWFR